ncbi:MAG: aminopeptidase P family N-terminal domain-containing protein, partial [Candidatus Neomarinimicrobiota bacterium]|nr:aminopeptidase P family N-terminal domain-containing protein [Candidatus Neomarinimicrobiota bacterium]
MTEKIYLDRQQKLKNVIVDSGLDGMLITNLTNIRYICGFTGSAGTCLVTLSGQYFITDGRYIEQSKEQVKGFDRYIDMDTNLSIIKKNKLINNDTKIGFEGDHVNFTLYDSMKKMFTGIHWESTKMILEDLASVKDKTELDAIRTAVEITDRVYEEILPMLRPGYTEKQVANTMVSKYREYGDGEAYSPIVATGPNGALPHAVPTD